jgi:CRP-like cAMP-binding protein
MQAIESMLAEHPFLQGLEPRHFQLLAECAVPAQYKSGEFLCRGDHEATQFFLVYHGRVAVEIFSARRGPITIQTLGDGDVLGWLWYEKPYHWHFDARAMEPTRVVILDVRCLFDKFEQNHELGYQIMKRYAHHIAVQFRVSKLQLMDMYGSEKHWGR